MKIAPISFKGTITITTYKDNNTKEITKVRTTKKQDGMLLKEATNIISKNGDAKKFHHKIQQSIGKEIKSNPQTISHLYIGGDCLYSNQQPYDTSYNKIYYWEGGCYTYPKTNITIDLMEPRERLSAAKKSLEKIHTKIEQMFNTKTYDCRFNKMLIHATPEDCAKAEEIIERTRYYLNGYIDGTCTSHLAKDCQTPAKAYESLVKGIMKALNYDHIEKTTSPNTNIFKNKIENNENTIEISSKDFDALKRAVHYLDSMNK